MGQRRYASFLKQTISNKIRMGQRRYASFLKQTISNKIRMGQRRYASFLKQTISNKIRMGQRRYASFLKQTIQTCPACCFSRSFNITIKRIYQKSGFPPTHLPLIIHMSVSFDPFKLHEALDKKPINFFFYKASTSTQ